MTGRVFVIISILLVVVVGEAQSRLEFAPLPHTARIFGGAPAGTYVTTVRATRIPSGPSSHGNNNGRRRPERRGGQSRNQGASDGRGSISYRLHHEGSDFSYFNIDTGTGNISTNKYIGHKTGSSYSIIVVAYDSSSGDTEYQTIPITVSESNRYPPVFETSNYKAEISAAMSPNDTILHVKASDLDTIPYNSEISYHFPEEGSAENATALFNIGLKDGGLTLAKPLPKPSAGSATVRLKFPIAARDGGSPVRWARTTVAIDIKPLSEPQDVRVVATNESWALVCWRPPLVGVPSGYVINFRDASSGLVYEPRSTGRVNVTNEQVGSEDASGRLCLDISGLMSWTNYELKIFAWTKRDVGLSKTQTFTTRTVTGANSNQCVRSCLNGNCVPNSNHKSGFTCQCNDGFYGEKCDLYNPCVKNPCQNRGECRNVSTTAYECHCLQGFYGENCASFDPCYIQPCSNGGKCISNSSKQFYCECRRGFTGSSCSETDPCVASHSVCSNGGVCQPDVSAPHGFRCHCPPNYTGATCDYQMDYCPEVTVAGDVTVTWPRTKMGRVARGECLVTVTTTQRPSTRRQYMTTISSYARSRFEWSDPGNNNRWKRETIQDGYVYRACVKGARGLAAWHPIDAITCQRFQEEPETTSTVTQTSTTTLPTTSFPSSTSTESPSPADILSSDLETMANLDPGNVSGTHLQEVSRQVALLVDYAVANDSVASHMFCCLSRLLEANASSFRQAGNDATDAILNAINRYSERVSLATGIKEIKFKEENLAVKIVNSADGSDEVEFAPEFANSGYHETAIAVPLSELETKRVTFIAFRNPKLFVTSSALNKRPPEDAHVVVATANVTGRVFHQGGVIYKMAFQSLQGNRNRFASCVYWNEQDRVWSTEGLSVLESPSLNNSDSHVKCISNHLTAFSVLFDPYPVYALDSASVNFESPEAPEVTFDYHKVAMSYITYICSSLSILGLIATILTYSLFRSLNRERSGKILLNLCIALLFLNAIFLLGDFLPTTDGRLSSWRCTLSGAALHYFMLASLGWMLVEALNMYQLLVTVFATSETRFMLKRMAFAWGVPLVIASATALSGEAQYARVSGYDRSTGSLCVLLPINGGLVAYYAAYITPCGLIIAINCAVFCLVARVLFQRRAVGSTTVGVKKLANTKKGGVTVAQVRGAFTVMTLLGVTWVFGALTAGGAGIGIVFDYAFCLANGLQGFVVFVFRCLQHPESRSAWSTFMRTGQRKRRRGTVGHSWGAGSSNGSGWGWFGFGTQQQNGSASHNSNSGAASGSSSKHNATSVHRRNTRSTYLLTSTLSSSDSKEVENVIEKKPASNGDQRTAPPPAEHSVLVRHVSGANDPPPPPVVDKVDKDEEETCNENSKEKRTSLKEGRDTSWQFLRAPPDGIEADDDDDESDKAIPYIEDDGGTPQPVPDVAAGGDWRRACQRCISINGQRVYLSDTPPRPQNLNNTNKWGSRSYSSFEEFQTKLSTFTREPFAKEY